MKLSRSLVLVLSISAIGVLTYLLMDTNHSQDESVDSDSDYQQSSPQKQNTSDQPLSRTEGLLDRLQAVKNGIELTVLSRLLGDVTREREALAAPEIDGVLSYIKQPRPDHIDIESWRLFINVALNAVKLRAADHSENQIANTLIHLASNSEDAVLRIYAMQHVAFWYPLERNSSNRQALLNLLRNALDGEDRTRPTALVVLNKLEQGGQLKRLPSKAQPFDLDTMSLSLIGDQEASRATRIKAIHTAARRQLTGAIPELKRIAGNKKNSIRIRKVAIYGIGQLGTKDDLPFLLAIEKNNARLNQALEPAIRKLTRDKAILTKEFTN